MTVTVVLADDHGSVRAGLRLILEASGEISVIGEAADGRVAVDQCRALKPDLVVMDIRMPTMDGIEATRLIRAEDLTQVLVLTTFDLDDYVLSALRAGAAGFILKTAGGPELVQAVLAVAAGDGVLAPEVTRAVLAAVANQPDAPSTSSHPEVADLTEREREVLRCLGQGMSNRDLAKTLTISPLTAKSHVSRVLAKLQLDSRVQASIVAREAGLV